MGLGEFFEALSAAKRWAEWILECSPKAIRASKQSYFRGLEESNLEAAMRKIYPAHQENKASLDYIEGPKAFAEKRKTQLAEQVNGTVLLSPDEQLMAAAISISSEARDRNNPISPRQISFQSSVIEQKLHPIRGCSPVVLGLRQGQV